MSGIGAHVKNTVMRRKNFLPHTSERAPISGADKNEKMPLIPIINPFMRKVCSGNVLLRTFIIGIVRRPHEKYSKNITTNA